MSSLIGRSLGQYQVIEMIGQGGMATVYRGHQTSIDRPVAIKVLPPHPGLDARFIDRFQLEARTIGSLQNPHILPLYDYGMTEDGILYLVMAYIDGGSLADEIERGPLPMQRVERIVRQIAGALDYAHRREVVHRDVKPGNILIDSEGNALLADFGIVKMLSGVASGITGTAVLGTPAYMPPEQAQGMEIDARADVYALGVMTYEMLTGNQPYQADTPMQLILQHLNEPVPDLSTVRPDLPKEVSAVLRRSLAKSPDDRYQSAIAFAEALTTALHSRDESREVARKNTPLDRVASDSPTQPDPTMRIHDVTAGSVSYPQTNPTQPQTQPQTVIVRDNNALLILGGFAVIALAIIVAAAVLLNGQNQTPPPTSDAGVAAVPTTDASEPTAEAEPTTAPTPIPATPVPAAAPTFGNLRYNSVNALGDSLSLSVQNLTSAGAGQVYKAWLVNTATEDILPLGNLRIDASGFGVLAFTDDQGRMLPAAYNALYITREASDTETSDSPMGPVVYSGSVPPEVSQALHSIFVADERGINGGSLLAGASDEVRFAAQHSGLAAGSTTVGGMTPHAEHTINILRGTEEDLNGDGRPQNPGRGFGVYVFLEAIEEAIQTATSAEPENIDLQQNAESLRVCVVNVRNWADRVVALEMELLAAESVEAVADEAAEARTLTARMADGFDANENGQIEPFEGECGLAQVPDYGIEFGNLSLREGPLDAAS